MTNHLDRFIERGNLLSSPILDDRFRWQGQEYLGTISDMVRDIYLEGDAAGRRENAERRLECRLSQFSSGRPQIGDTIVDLHDNTEYRIIDELSVDTTNAVYSIRKPMRNRRQ